MGIIGFEELTVYCIIGTETKERKTKQPLLIDLKVKSSFTSCGESDAIEDTINYVELASTVSKVLIDGKYRLLEKAAHEALFALFDEFPLASAWIKIRKSQAIPDAKYAIVEMEKFA